jgi:hypothetical protein
MGIAALSPSLIVKPGDLPASGLARSSRWTKSLTLFRRALSEALLSADRTTNVGGIPTHIVDLEAVRSEFYAIYIPKGDTPEQKQDSRKHGTCRDISGTCPDLSRAFLYSSGPLG